MNKLSLAIALAMLLTAPQADAKTKKKAQPKAPALTTLQIIERVNDTYQSQHTPEVRSFWDDAAYFTGNMEAYFLTGKAAYLGYSDRWARHNNWCGATERDKSKWLYKNYGETPQHVLFGDWQICFQTYIDMYQMNPEPYKIARAVEVISHECEMAATDFWWWADALYMVMPVFTKLYKVTGEEKYLDKLYDNFKFADDLMYDTEEHLYYRDGRYVYPKHKTAEGKKDFWARGDGWVLAGLAKVLTDMPADYKHRPFFEQRFKELAAAVAKCQQPEGHWTRSLLDPEQAEGYETSGTAFYTYGLLWGMNHGLLDKGTYKPTTDKAWKYLTETALQPDFTVGYVQPIGDKAIKGQLLTAKSTANFGTGAFLLAACEKVRFDDDTISPADNKTFRLTLSNPTDDLRQEAAELDAQKVFECLGISGGRQFTVTGQNGKEVAYQLTYDGKLLIDAVVRAKGEAVYTFRKGTPTTFYNTCYGRVYPERLDDMAWENDRMIYRSYGPALQQRGEKSYGNDIWVKNTPDLEAEKRYRVEQETKPRLEYLRRTDKAAAERLNLATSYHIEQGHGLDCYAVGPTLGCGTPALLDGGNLVYPYCYRDCEILDNGPLRFTVRLTYGPAKYKTDDNVVETRLVSLDKYSHFNKATVSYTGLSTQADVAAGVVVHADDTEHIALQPDYVAYADPTEEAARHNFVVYVGAIFPDRISETSFLKFPQSQNGAAGHALGIRRDYKSGEPFTYYFGAAWSKYDCRSFKEWQLMTEQKISEIKNPLQVVQPSGK